MAPWGRRARRWDERVHSREPRHEERRDRALLAAILVILSLGVAQLVGPALSRSATWAAVGNTPTRSIATSPVARRVSDALSLVAEAAPLTAPPPASPTTPGTPSTSSRAATSSSPAPPISSPAGSPLPAPVPGVSSKPGRLALQPLFPVVPPSTFPPGLLVVPPMGAVSPLGYGCAAALAYLAANQAPGFVDICGPQSAGPGHAGLTTALACGPICTTGTIYIACPAPIVYQNEASNSWKFSDGTTAPLDPWGGVPRRDCRAGDIAPS